LRKNKNKLTNEQIKEINKTLTEINKLPDFKEKYFYIDEKDEKELKNTKEDAQKKIIPESIKDYIQRVNPDFYPNLPSVYEAANKYKISPALLIAVMQNDTKL
jgi:hypothetical protein